VSCSGAHNEALEWPSALQHLFRGLSLHPIRPVTQPFDCQLPDGSARRRRIRRALASLLIAALGGTFLSILEARAEIVIGLATADTGRNAETSGALKSTAEAALAKLNASGGVLGELLRLVTVDDSCTEAGGAAAAAELVRAGARLALGHPCDRAALSGAAVYAPAGVLFLATATRHAALTERRAGTTIYRLSGRDDRQGAAAGAWLASASPAGRIAIVQDRTAYARGLTAAVTAALAERALPAPVVFPIVAGEKAYAPVVTGIMDANAEAVFFAGYPAEATIILSGLRRAGSKARFLGSDSLATPDFTALPIARDPGVRLMLRPGLVGEPAQMERNLVDLAEATQVPVAANGDRLTPLMLEAAISIWAEAARRAGSTSALALISALDAGRFDMGSLGTVSFDEKGDARIPSFIAAAWTGSHWQPQD
jgi:branched-chain amino acid transport system substrate-binding protein